jgi:hypothetical protein
VGIDKKSFPLLLTQEIKKGWQQSNNTILF